MSSAEQKEAARRAALGGHPEGPRLKINELFLSIQGETTFAGRPCVFVRTTGCPLRCCYCDTEHAFFAGENTTLEAVRERVLAFGVPLVSITGGEPLIQRNVFPLMSDLCDAGCEILLETSGAFDIAPVDERVHVIMDIKCPDSGESSRNRWQNIELLAPKDEVKFVLLSQADYHFARETIETHRLHERCGAVLLSTAFDQLEPRQVVEWMLEDRLPARFQLQLHKQIWPADMQGV